MGKWLEDLIVKWKKLILCFSVLLLIMFASLAFYLASPKYEFHHPQGARYIIKSNRFTGEIIRVPFSEIRREELSYDKDLFEESSKLGFVPNLFQK